MSLKVGDRIGAYAIVEPIGRGGMGEVYRAHDTRLDRAVAIKLLLEGWNSRPDDVLRFEREARLLASLNHPNIAAIHDVTEVDGRTCLVLEFVDGINLSERIRKGAVPVREAVQLATQIASALSAAHDRGIIHRDLKPANIRIAHDGRVKVLDFGIAKPAYEASPSAATEQITETGMVIGTLAYMSPEQARGKHVSKQTDIWAFGCVLFEMLTGRLTFGRGSGPETAVAILERDPDWNLLPASTPAAVRTLLRRCLRKNPGDRLHDIADARLELEDALSSAGDAVAAPHVASARRWPAIGAAAVIAAIGAGALMYALMSTAPAPTDERPTPAASLQLPLPADQKFVSGLAVSPDGRHVAYVISQAGTPVVVLRPPDQAGGRVIPDSNGAASPFFSPDGQWVAFFADGKLKKAPVAGGVTSVITAAPTPRGGGWTDRNEIVFAPTFFGPLHIVSADGGTSRQLTQTGTARMEVAHRWPETLPGGDLVMFTVGPAMASLHTWDAARIDVQSIRTNERWTIVEGGTYPKYVASSRRLLFVRSGTVYGAPLSDDARRLTAPPTPIVANVRPVGNGAADVDVSDMGWIYHASGSSQLLDLVWVDRTGLATRVTVDAREYGNPRISPDDRRVALTVYGRDDDLYLLDLETQAMTRLTFGASNFWPVWIDDRRLFLGSNRDGYPNIYLKTLDGSVPDERLTTESATHTPMSWSPATQMLAYANNHPSTGIDLWLWSARTKQSQPLLQSPANETGPAISPNGRWVAYLSNESGANRVYVRQVAGDAKWQVSGDGGTEVRWLKDGSGIVYRHQASFMLARVSEAPTFAVAAPVLLFSGDYELSGTGFPNYDVASDGGRFLIVRQRQPTPPVTALNVSTSIAR
jgi:Tol biopolymer transport system component